jgi:tetratricopeptide (TPR) repeat protein
VALIGVWAIYQPLHAENDSNAAIAALGRGDTEAALRQASSAVSADPVGVDALTQLATIDEAIGRTAAADAALQKAVGRQPENPQTWLALGQFYLRTHQRAQALTALRRAQQLDLGSTEIAQAVAQAAR